MGSAPWSRENAFGLRQAIPVAGGSDGSRLPQVDILRPAAGDGDEYDSDDDEYDSDDDESDDEDDR